MNFLPYLETNVGFTTSPQTPARKNESFKTAPCDQKSTLTNQTLAASYKKCDYSGTSNHYDLLYLYNIRLPEKLV
jgi:hypothetical protein